MATKTILPKGGAEGLDEGASPTLADRLPGIEDGLPQAMRRRVHTFTIPEKVRQANDPKTIGLHELTFEEESAVFETGGTASSNHQTAIRLLRRSLAEVDGRPVNKSANEDEILLARWSPKVRKLAVQGFGFLHNTTDEEDADFFGSVAVR